ncbi:MAG: beta-galactosidase [Candidatus Hydrogenedentota bacterium]
MTPPETMLSGEIHYFRIPREDWPDRLRTADRTGLNTVSTYVPWMVHEPVEGRFDFSLVDDWIRAVADAGLKLFIRVGPVSNAELIGEGLPGWLAGDREAMLRGGPDDPSEATFGPSYLSPRFQSAVAAWHDALLPRVAAAQVTRGGPITAVQLCNEIGMIPWLAHRPDRASHVEAFYREFLRARYGEIGRLNDAYETQYGSFAEISQPPNIPTTTNRLQLLDRARFFRAYFARYFRTLADHAARHGIEVPLVANIPMFWDYDTRGRGHQAPLTVSFFADFAAAVPGVSLGGAYQMRRLDHENSHDIAIATEMVRACLRRNIPADRAGMPLCVELQTGILSDRPRLYPSDVDMNLRLSLGHGLAGVNGYMFAGGSNADGMGWFGHYHEWQAPVAADGSTRPHIKPIETLGSFLRGFGTQYSSSSKTFSTAIGFHAPDWMTEYIDGSESEEIKSVREAYAFDGAWRLLDILGRPFSVVDLETDSTWPASIWLFTWDRMDAPLQQRLADYVLSGGRLAIGPRLPSRDFRGRACRILADSLGLETTRRPRENVMIDGADHTSVEHTSVAHTCVERFVGSMVDTVKARPGDEILASTRDGSVAALLGSRGSGRVLYTGFGIEDKFLYWREIFSRWCDMLGIPELIRIRPFGEIGAQGREGEDGSFLTVSNPHDLPVRATVEIPHRGYGPLDLALPPRGAWILPIDVALGNGWRLLRANAEAHAANFTDHGLELEFRAPALGETFEAEVSRSNGSRIILTADASAGIARARID